MIFRGTGDPFTLGPEALDEVRALVASPHATAMEGLEYLEHFGLTNPPNWEDEIKRSEWFRPMVIGLGFGVRLSVELLNCNAPDADVSEYLILYDSRFDKESGCYFAGHELANMVPYAREAAEDTFDPNVLRAVNQYSLSRLNLLPRHELTFLAAMVHGHDWVREAFEAWEFNHPVETAERLISLHVG